MFYIVTLFTSLQIQIKSEPKELYGKKTSLQIFIYSNDGLTSCMAGNINS